MCVCNKGDTNNLNSATTAPLALQHNNIPANAGTMARIGKGCFNHDTINRSVSRVKVVGNIKVAPCAAVIPEGRCWQGPGNTGDDKSILKILHKAGPNP